MFLSHLFKALSLTVIFCVLISSQTSAQTAGAVSPVTPDDYGKWETLRPGILSPDGGWLAYQIIRVNEENELRVRDLKTDSLIVVPYGESPSFSSDS
ncbi:MAG: hypothetical protein QF732_08030, partial [Nitrospinaceae bacterium]|nr:hypothetical protein [Nitrospinaceae bacterium]